MTTQTEALKLALEALEDSEDHLAKPYSTDARRAITAIKEALAQPTSGDYAHGYVEGFNDACMPKPAQQEPVAWMHTKLDGVVVSHRPADLDRHPDRWKALYKNTPPCSTCEALARTVMLDQTSHDATPPQRKPLTHEQKDILNFLFGLRAIDDVWFGDKHPTERGQYWWRKRLAKAFQEAAHSIKEKNT